LRGEFEWVVGEIVGNVMKLVDNGLVVAEIVIFDDFSEIARDLREICWNFAERYF
jgi:hypothetical protein